MTEFYLYSAADILGQQKDRFFSMDGKKSSVLRQTVSQALKSSKWDSVATLIAGMSMSQEGYAGHSDAAKKDTEMPMVSIKRTLKLSW